MIHAGTKENRITEMSIRQKLQKSEKAVREDGWEPQWLNLTDTIRDWERQLSQWEIKHTVLDELGDVDKDIDAEIREVEGMDLQL